MLARDNLKRGEELGPSGGISKEDLDQRRQAVAVGEANVEYARETLRLAVIGPRQELAHLYREFGRCDIAIGLYLGILKSVPSEQASRVGLVTCALYTGDYVVARWAAIQGAGWDNPTFRRLARVADSALKAKAPLHTVIVPDSTLVMHEAIGRREVLFGK